MTGGSASTLIAMVALTSAGAVAFRQYVATDAIAWLVFGLAAYNASNVAWIVLIGQTGLGRATVYAAACQIILLTGASALLGDVVGRLGWLAAGLACLAVLVASFHDDGAGTDPQPANSASAAPTHSSSLTTSDLNSHETSQGEH